MKKYQLKQILAICVLALLPGVAPALELEGVKVPGSVQLKEGGAVLPLNGAGVRTKFFFKVYVGALYLEQKTKSALSAIGGAGFRRVAMYMLRDLGADQFVEALEDGLKNNNSAADLARFDAPVRQLRGIFDALKTARTGDVIFLDYLPGAGTRITVNGGIKGMIAGDDFSRALLRIWLGDNPTDSDLKQGMLGG